MSAGAQMGRNPGWPAAVPGRALNATRPAPRWDPGARRLIGAAGDTPAAAARLRATARATARGNLDAILASGVVR